MKKIYVIALFAVLSLVGFAQPTKYWVQFTDKGNNPFSLSSPSAYLSARALARRTVHGIAIDSTDLPVTPSYVAGVAAIPGAIVHSQSKWLNGVVIFTTTPSSTLPAIAALPYVATVGNIGLRVGDTTHLKFSDETFSPALQNNQRSGSISSSTLNYGPSFNQIDMLGGVCLHNAGFRGQGMQIAIIDAGFYHANQLPIFDTLFLNNRILGTWDFVAGDSMVYEDNQHGSMVLSCMGGNLPGQLVGTAPDASFWLLRSEDAPTENLVEEYYWASAAEFADSVGADVINTSLGYNQFDDASNNHTYADLDGHTTPCARAVNFAARKGMAVCASAGNEGGSPWFYIGTPADADSALTVAATDAAGIVTGFSSRGSLTLFGHQKPDVGAQGANTVICDPFGVGTQTGNGTSFSSPVTCGLVACLWQAHPAFTNMQIIQMIQQSASQATTPDSLLGYGIPDFCAANLALAGGSLSPGNEDFLFGISPNPFVDHLDFTFYSTVDQDVFITLYDEQGRLIVNEGMFAVGSTENHFVLNQLMNVSSGVYFLRVKTTNGIYTQKVVKGQ